MAQPPRISVLLPVRNAAATLDSALGSLAEQKFEDFEVIAVDDGSADETPALLAAWASRDPRVRAHRVESSGNIARALIFAAARASGSLLARFDADDLALPKRFCRQVEFLAAHPEVGLVATGVRTLRGTLDRDGAIDAAPSDGARRYEQWLDSVVTSEEIALNLWIESPLPHPTVMMRREVYDQVGGYRDVGWPEDYDLWLRMLRDGVRMAKIAQPLVLWRDLPTRASRVQAVYGLDRFLDCRAHHLAQFIGVRAIVVWGAGRDGRRLAKALLREGARIDAFLDIDPRKIGRTARGRPILDSEAWLTAAEAAADVPAPQPPLLVAAVGAAGARERIRARLIEAGFREGRDFLCAA